MINFVSILWGKMKIEVGLNMQIVLLVFLMVSFLPMLIGALGFFFWITK